MKKWMMMAVLAACFIWGCGTAEETADRTGEPAAESGEQAGAEPFGESVFAEEIKTAQEEEEPTFLETEETQETEKVPQEEEKQALRPKVKGIFVTGAMAGTSNMDHLIDLVDRTELNTLVIDIKDDEGRVVCDVDLPLVNEIGAVRHYVKDMPGLVRKCKEKGIYLIARIVTFKDPFLAEAKPEWSLHNTDGSIFRDKGGLAWVNPYEKQVWDYLLSIAEAAVDLGFDEVQFDYIRFSTDSGMKNVDFGPETGERSRQDVITEFTAYASDALHRMGAAVSADVYGVVIDSETDRQIVGQDYYELTKYLDAVSPMVYPSHYGPYNYNIPVPDAQPYDTVLAAMQASRKVLAGLDPRQRGPVSGDGVSENDVSGNDVSGNDVSQDSGAESGQAAVWSTEEIAALAPDGEVRAVVRPWLQDFTATWVKGHIKYGPEQVRDQIRAVYDAGYEEWILWNAANRYTEGGLYGPDGEPLPAETEETAEEGGT